MKNHLVCILSVLFVAALLEADPAFVKKNNTDELITGPILEIVANNPSQVYVDDVLKGTTPLILTDISAYSKELVLRSQFGFLKVKIKFDSSINGLSAYHLDLLPLSGRLVLESNPKNLDIYINGELSGKTPLVFDKMPAGIYSIVMKDTHHYYEAQVNIEAEKEVVLSPYLTTLCRLEFKFLEKDSLITLTSKGETLSFSADQEILIEPGNYELVVNSQFHKKIEKTLTITADRIIDINPHMYQPMISFLNLRKSSRVYLDGRDITSQIVDGIFVTKPGSHYINIQQKAHLDFNQTVMLKEDENLEIPVVYLLSPEAQMEQKKFLGYVLAGVGIAGSAACLILNNDDMAVSMTDSYESYTGYKYISLGGAVGLLGVSGFGFYLIFKP